jgi:hypothetical protein
MRNLQCKREREEREERGEREERERRRKEGMAIPKET